MSDVVCNSRYETGLCLVLIALCESLYVEIIVYTATTLKSAPLTHSTCCAAEGFPNSILE